MKTSTRNQTIAVLMISILLLLAFWWWTSRTPSKSFSIAQIRWTPPSTLQLQLTAPADKQLYLGKTALMQSFIPATTPTSDQKALIDALTNYPFVISADSDNPGIDQSGYVITVGSMPKNLPATAQLLTASAAATNMSTLRINLK